MRRWGRGAGSGERAERRGVKQGPGRSHLARRRLVISISRTDDARDRIQGKRVEKMTDEEQLRSQRQNEKETNDDMKWHLYRYKIRVKNPLPTRLYIHLPTSRMRFQAPKKKMT